MIVIRSTQRKIRVPIDSLQKDVERIMSALGYEGFALTIWLTTNETSARYNKQYRNKKGPTNILSFPYQVRNPHKRLPEFDKELGDILIAVPYVFREAQEQRIPFLLWLRKLIIHGICHLVGYDHETDCDYTIMQQQEDRLLALLSRNS